MKSYKLVRNLEMENKAERLGCSRAKEDLSGVFMYVIVGDEESSQYWFTNNYYGHRDYQEITQADFLALPEPLKVGDWVKFTNVDGSIIFKVDKLNSATVSNIVIDDCDTAYYIDSCTKLTQEQIDILGLE